MKKYFLTVKQKASDRIALSLVIITITTCAMHLAVLFSSNYAFGADGYYYAAQVAYFFRKGYYFSPDSSLFLHFLTAFSLFGNDIVVTNKIAVAIVSTLLIWPAYLLGKNASDKTTGLVLALLVVSNSFVSYFTFEYLKNLGGILFFLFFLNQLLVMIKKETIATRDILLLFFLFLLVFFTHKLMGGAGLLFLLFFIVYQFRNHWKKLLILFSAVILIVSVAGIVLPNILNATDFERFDSLFTLSLQWTPYLYYQSTNLPYSLVPELIALTIAPVATAFYWKKISPQTRIFSLMMMGIYIIINIPFLAFKEDEFAFRLFILIFIPSSFFISLLFAGKRFLYAALLALLLIPYQWYTLSLLKESPQYDYALYSDILPLIEIPWNTLLIVHQGFDYFYCYNGRRHAFHYLPEEKHKGRPIFRLAAGVPKEMFERYTDPSAQIRYLPGGYTLLPEKEWQSFLKLIPADKRKEYCTWRNPHIRRPSFMKRNDKFDKD